MRITYRGIEITYDRKVRGFFWHHGSASNISQLKSQIDYWLRSSGEG